MQFSIRFSCSEYFKLRIFYNAMYELLNKIYKITYRIGISYISLNSCKYFPNLNGLII